MTAINLAPGVTLHAGDCLDVLRELPDCSVDAIVTDPPYGLGFMGKKWDTPGSFVERKAEKRNSFDHVGGNHNPTSSADAARTRRVEAQRFGEFCAEWAEAAFRVLKPGGHVLAFGGTRTWHRLAVGIEDAGFEIRDSLAWLYGSGFPKSMDVSKAIDKAAGAERETVGRYQPPNGKAWNLTADVARAEVGAVGHTSRADSLDITAPATPEAEQWQGWGTALKPAFEPIVVGRKPLGEKTVAANVLAHGTGGLNIDACRVGGGARPLIISKSEDSTGILGNGLNGSSHGGQTTAGRWPANVILDESQAEVLDEQSGPAGSNSTTPGSDGTSLAFGNRTGGVTHDTRADGGASRFFYVAKADASERVRVDGIAHPTVKPLALMRWLVRLVTPPGGTVLEPFAGSGTTVEACLLEGFHCIAIEREADYLPLIRQRVARRLDPVEAVRGAGEDGGLFDLLGEEPA